MMQQDLKHELKEDINPFLGTSSHIRKKSSVYIERIYTACTMKSLVFGCNYTVFKFYGAE
jgi:hypothetical protein